MGDTALFEKLRASFPNYVRIEYEDVGKYTAICVNTNRSYMTFVVGPFGPYLVVSAKKPEHPCAEADASFAQTMLLDAGLRLGQSKAEAAAALKINSVFDATQIAFEETDPLYKRPVYHKQAISMKFNSDHLTLILIEDYREGNMDE